MLKGLFDPLANQFENKLRNLSQKEGYLLESKLTWMVNIIASVIGGRLATSATTEEDNIDGELAARLFKLMKLHDARSFSFFFSSTRFSNYFFFFFFSYFCF